MYVERADVDRMSRAHESLRELARVQVNRHLYTRFRADTHTYPYMRKCIHANMHAYIHIDTNSTENTHAHTCCRAGTRSHAGRDTHLPAHRHRHT